MKPHVEAHLQRIAQLGKALRDAGGIERAADEESMIMRVGQVAAPDVERGAAQVEGDMGAEQSVEVL